jgi:glycosyltransferase involved in cell wall biosynthesis
MRILHLLASPVFSGPAQGLLELARAQQEQGHDVHVALDRKQPGLASEEPAVPRFAEEGLLDERGLEVSPHSSARALMSDVLRLRRLPLDVIHAHFSHDHWLARMGRPKGARLIRSIHAPRSLSWSTPYADALTVPYAQLLERVGRRPALVLPALVGREFIPVPDVGALRNTLGFAGAPLVGMVSTFQASRRHGLGLEAFARLRAQHPEAHLVLAGDGVLEPELRRQVGALGLERAVTFTGYLSRGAYLRVLQALDEVWILGLGNDWAGRAAAQARACDVRVVAVAEGALAELADALVEALTPEAVCAASLGVVRRLVVPSKAAEVAAAVEALYASPRDR